MKLTLALALLALAGCQTMREHPRTSAFIASSLVLSAGLALRDRGSSSDEPRMSAPLVPDCAKYPELCR